MRKFLLLLLALNLFSNNVEKICDIYFERKTQDYFVESVDQKNENFEIPSVINPLSEQMGIVLNSSPQRNYLKHLVDKNLKLDDSAMIAIFDTLSEKQILYLLEYSVYGKKLNFWKRLISKSSTHHHKNLIGIINKTSKDKIAWEGFQKLLGKKKYSKSTMEKSLNFLLALKYETKRSEKLVVNVLNRISDGRLTPNTVKLKIAEELKENIYLKYTGRRVVLKFRNIVNRLLNRSSKKSNNVLDLDYSPEALMNILSLSKKNLDLVYKDVKSLEETINKSFVNMIFQNIETSDSARVLKQIREIKQLQADEFLDPRVFEIMKEINWDHAPSQVFFKLRNNSKDDGVLKSIFILDNLLKFSYLRTVDNNRTIKEYFEKMLKEFEENQHVIGISQMYAELGAGTSKVSPKSLNENDSKAFSKEMVSEIESYLNKGEEIFQNHKFRGAHFTYEYFLKIKKQPTGLFKSFKLIGFEVDQYIVKDSKGKRHIIMEYLNGNEAQFAFVTNKKIKYIDKKSVTINKGDKTISIGKKTYKYGAKGSKIGQHRKADFVYQIGSKIYVKEMKNYLSLMNVFNNDGELFFDLLIAQKLGLNSFLNIQWVVNGAAHIGPKAVARKEQIGHLIGSLISKKRYGDFLDSLGGEKSSPEKMIDYFADFFNEVNRKAHNKFGIAFFKPDIDTDTIFKKE